MKRFLGSLVALSVLAAGCSGPGDAGLDSTQPEPGTAAPINTTTNTRTVEPAPSDEPLTAEEAFAPVFHNPAAYAAVSQHELFVPDGTYSYAFADVTGDGVAEMLLKTDGHPFAPIKVLVAADGGVVPIGGYVVDGAAEAGGGRMSVRASQTGRGIYQISGNSAQPDWKHELFGVVNGNLETLETQPIGFDEELPDYVQIAWLDIH
ncbi:hypothetical protein [Corynebacterium uterequi]|uniref:Lipoprotein n=1 Tax=Corynebacterium uterequi TaxID=1072256 RepID=A0A0G3HCD3_9CORY|nr:hypothetical protein [Corynebacterium uterequi]AKK10350.1 hypothetical protein CUTER_01670 [Corynebacterium uterequi]